MMHTPSLDLAADPDLIVLREPILALATAARVCGHWMRDDTPDIGELRVLVAKMIEAAEHAAIIVKR